MTTFEHALLGLNGALAAGLHRRHSWRIAAMAAVAAASADWDALPIAFSSALFAAGHRVWGHNLLACIMAGAAIGLIDYRFDLVTRLGRRITRLLRLKVGADALLARQQFPLGGAAVWVVTAILAALTHLPADIVVSGSETLPVWEVQLLWPFSTRGYAFPMVRWGDIGITLMFIAGMFAMVRWRSRVQLIALLTLVGVAAYLVIRRMLMD
jgi:hypothetical protein